MDVPTELEILDCLRHPGFSLIQSRPLNLTESELSQYDGSDPNKPIYLALEYVSMLGTKW